MSALAAREEREELLISIELILSPAAGEPLEDARPSIGGSTLLVAPSNELGSFKDVCSR